MRHYRGIEQTACGCIAVPSLPWRFEGTSRQGHAYVWTLDGERAAPAGSLVRAQYAAAMSPPSDGSGPSIGGGGGGKDKLKSLGSYDRRGDFRGNKDGAIAYFSKPGGVLMMCGWSNASNSWEDVGALEGVGGV